MFLKPRHFKILVNLLDSPKPSSKSGFYELLKSWGSWGPCSLLYATNHAPATASWPPVAAWGEEGKFFPPASDPDVRGHDFLESEWDHVI